jgi:hydrogenase small subunit
MAASRRPSVIWLPFQECTGCTESITRSHSPTIEGMIFDMISLDYQETLMAAAGFQAEEALHNAMKDNYGKYLLIIDGSIPLGVDGAYSCIAGRSNLELLKEAARGAAAIVASPSSTFPDARRFRW